MKVLISVLTLILLFINIAKAQYDSPLNQNSIARPPADVYLGISSGINNINGMLGMNLEVRLSNQFTALGALGVGLWGSKQSAGARYYKDYPKGMYLGAAISRHSGYNEYDFSYENSADLDKVNMTMTPSINLPLSIGFQGSIANYRIRYYAEFGYSILLSNDGWEVNTPGVSLIDRDAQYVDSNIPGGIIIGFGFSIAWY